MKKFYTIILFVLVSVIANAQSPDSFKKNKLQQVNNESSLSGQSSNNILDRILTNPEYKNEFSSIKQMRKEGVSDDKILQYLDEKAKQRSLHNKNIAPVQQLTKVHPPVITSATCTDMGGEIGWNSWVATTGDFSGGVITWGGSAAPTSPRFNLTGGAGNDACTPGFNIGDPAIPVVAPGFGSASIQMGQIQTNGGDGGCNFGCAERLNYSLTVTNQDTDFTYSYALVMQDGGHIPSDQPFAGICIKDGGGNPISGGCFTYNVPGFYQAACDTPYTYYKPWTTVHINLAAYLGQTLSIEIINTDCGAGGHFAQSYWDFQCGNILPTPTPICIITVDSTSTKNVIIWDKPQNTSIDSFKIFRQIASVYKHIGSVPYAALSAYTDTTNGVNPNITSYRYAISVIDNSGNESSQSVPHKTIHLSVSPASPCGYNLFWNDYVGFPVLQYRILRDTTGNNNWQVLDSVSWGNNSWTDISCSLPPNNTTYVVELLAQSNGCTSTMRYSNNSTQAAIVKSRSNVKNNRVSSINSLLNSNNISLYPQPASNEVIVGFGFRQNKVTLELYNTLGSMVLKETAQNTQTVNLNLNNLSAGVYSLAVTTEIGKTVKKLVKE